MPEDLPEGAVRIFPELTTDSKAVRWLADAVFECIDNAVEMLIDHWTGPMPDPETDEVAYDATINELADRLFNLAVKGIVE